MTNCYSFLVTASLLTCQSVPAQAPAPVGADLVAFAARRFPQPVRVGDLIDRTVLLPLESRPVLGHVLRVVRRGDGKIELVMSVGGIFGFDARSIAVPVEAMVLLGNELEVLDFTPQQLKAFPTYQQDDAVSLAAGDSIRMGLAHPSH